MPLRRQMPLRPQPLPVATANRRAQIRQARGASKPPDSLGAWWARRMHRSQKPYVGISTLQPEPPLHCALLPTPIEFTGGERTIEIHIDCAAISREACHDDKRTRSGKNPARGG